MRKQVVELQCSRCERKEQLEESEARKSREFKAELGSNIVHFEDLCNPCYKTVLHHLETIGKKIEGLSPDRTIKKEKVQSMAKEKEGSLPPPLPVRRTAT